MIDECAHAPQQARFVRKIDGVPASSHWNLRGARAAGLCRTVESRQREHLSQIPAKCTSQERRNCAVAELQAEGCDEGTRCHRSSVWLSQQPRA